MLLVGGGLALGHGAVAWAGFFDGCIPLEPVGVITVTQHTTVKNETVTLLGDAVRVCVITVADGVTLEFKNVRVTATGPTRLRFVGGINSRLLIRGSTFTTCDNDVLGGFGAGMLIDHSVLQDPVEGAGNCD